MENSEDISARSGADEASIDEVSSPGQDMSCSGGAGKLVRIVEALLFASESPLTLERMHTVLEEYERSEIQNALKKLIHEYAVRDCALEIVEVASGYQVRTRPEFASWIRRLKQQRPPRLSRSSLETLAIIAYNQPITRAEIEHIRGVDSMAVLGSLVEKQLVRILGRKDVPGRPLIYGTTPEFLEVFGLKNLKSLPTLKEIEEMLGSGANEQVEDEDRAQHADQGALGQVLDGMEDKESKMNEGVVGENEAAGANEHQEGCAADLRLDEDALGEEVSTQEIDEILKATQARHRMIKKELGLVTHKDDVVDEEQQ